MSKKLFQVLDENIFRGIDSLKSTPQFTQFINSIEGLPEEYQKVLNQALTYFLSFFPIVFLIVAFLVAGSFRGTVQNKEELISEMIQYNQMKAKSQRIGNDLIGGSPLNGENGLKAKLNSLIGDYGLRPGDLNVLSFENEKFGELTRSLATITFKNLSTPKLVGLLDSFLVQEKVKIENLKLKKFKDKLQGELSFIHYARQASPE